MLGCTFVSSRLVCHTGTFTLMESGSLKFNCTQVCLLLNIWVQLQIWLFIWVLRLDIQMPVYLDVFAIVVMLKYTSLFELVLNLKCYLHECHRILPWCGEGFLCLWLQLNWKLNFHIHRKFMHFTPVSSCIQRIRLLPTHKWHSLFHLS